LSLLLCFTAPRDHVPPVYCLTRVQRLGVKTPAMGDAALEEMDGAALSAASLPQPLLDALQRAGLAQEAPVLVLYIALSFLCTCYVPPQLGASHLGDSRPPPPTAWLSYGDEVSV